VTSKSRRATAERQLFAGAREGERHANVRNGGEAGHDRRQLTCAVGAERACREPLELRREDRRGGEVLGVAERVVDALLEARRRRRA
jgi:hypothetical protein